MNFKLVHTEKTIVKEFDVTYQSKKYKRYVEEIITDNIDVKARTVWYIATKENPTDLDWNLVPKKRTDELERIFMG